jgi:large subunit ribosomal protein L9
MPKFILLQDLEGLGNAGDVVNVKKGYARNFLLPKKCAAPESPSALRQLAARKDKIENQRKEEREKAEQMAEKLSSIELVIAAHAGDDKKLFGSVSATIIAEELAKNKIDIDFRRMIIETPIRELGEYTIKIKLYKEIIPSLKIKVVKS